MQEKEPLYFNIDVPAFLAEIRSGMSQKQSYVMGAPMQILMTKLAKIAGRAIELNDPELNILMLETKLFDVEHDKIQGLISKQKERIKTESK